jgi:anti-sigma regulatory factor (Ser/Thr protein kinase)
MRRSWELPADLGAARQARSHVSALLSHHDAVDDAALIASELVANAVEHGDPPIELSVEATPAHIRITVSSTETSSLPELRSATAEDRRGRGLTIVESLAHEWGWQREDGRILVWAELSAPRSPAHPTGTG